MKKYALFFAILLTLSSCAGTHAPELTRSVAKYSELKKLDLNLYLEPFIVFDDKDVEYSEILTKTIKLMQAKKYKELDKLISNALAGKRNAQDAFFAKSLWLFYQGKYEEARITLASVDEIRYNPAREILSIDIEYEKSKSEKTYEPRKIIQLYQALYDKYYRDDVLKKIIEMRVKLVKHDV